VEYEEPHDEIAVAYAVPKTVGNAVVRNRIRRQLRAVFDHEQADLVPGLYLIKADFAAKDLPYEQLRHHIVSALERAELHR
jgi:ribonuclease P protein component